MSVTGKGHAARRGGINGDLLVVIEEEQHKELIRDGNDLVYNLFISIPEAILGTTAEIPLVDGRENIKIDAGTQSGKILRLRGKGIPELNGYGQGDVLVQVNVWIPSSVSRDEKKILEQFKDSSSFDPEKNNASKNVFERIETDLGKK